MPVSPHVRELRAKAVTYGRVIAGWATYPPSAPQVQAMVECVADLEQKVAAAKRSEVSHVSRAPRAHGQSGEPPPILKVPPDGYAWSAAVEETGARRRIKNPDGKTIPPASAATVRPPARPMTSAPPGGITVPPVSAQRPVDPHTQTPTPALLRTRRSR
jgi:hypothetical protein